MDIELRIAGKLTTSDWKTFQKKLIVGNQESGWEKAYNDFFYKRVDSRYLIPISILNESKRWDGEGFSIMTIACAMIEFLESTYQGKKFVHTVKDKKREYDTKKSKSLFKSFLREREPFKQEFQGNLSKDFYSHVRCGLLHEARLKENWVIDARKSDKIIKIIDGKRRIYRVRFIEAIHEYLNWYKNELMTEKFIQENFLFKMNSLCE